MIRDRKDTPRFEDVTDAEWNDYRWQLRNRLTTSDNDRRGRLPDEEVGWRGLG